MTNLDTDKQIYLIIEDMNFHNIALAMRTLKWTWAGSSKSPTVKDLKITARRLLQQAAGHGGGNWVYYTTSSGGFSAHIDCNGYLSLDFVLEESDAEFLS